MVEAHDAGKPEHQHDGEPDRGLPEDVYAEVQPVGAGDEGGGAEGEP